MAEVVEASDDGKSFWCEAPPGWKKRVTYRSSTTVNNRSKADVYFYAPSDSPHTTRFRSEKKLREYLLKNTGIIEDLPPPEAFDWSYPGGTREGKCKNGPSLTAKAAPDTPRHTHPQTTEQNDSKKRLRESPQDEAPSEAPFTRTAGNTAPAVGQEAANGAREEHPGSDAQELGEGNKVPNAVDTGSDRGVLKVGTNEVTPAPKKKKGRPSAAEKRAAEKLVVNHAVVAPLQNVREDPPAEASKEKSGETRGVGELAASLAGPELPKKAVVPKRKGRPPRIKGAGKDGAAAARGNSATSEAGKDDVRGESGAERPEGAVPDEAKVASESTERVLVVEPAHQSMGLASPVADARADTSEAGSGREQLAGDAKLVEGGAEPPLEQRAAAPSVPEDGPFAEACNNAGVSEPLKEKEPADVVGVSEEGGSFAAVQAQELQGAVEGADAGAEAVRDGAEQPVSVGPVDDGSQPASTGGESESGPLKAEGDSTPKRQAELADTAEISSLHEHVTEKMGVKLENIGEGPEKSQPSKGVGVAAEEPAPDGKEGPDGTGTPLSILDAERDRALRGAGDSGPDTQVAEEASLGAKDEPELTRSPDLQCSETVPSPEQAGNEEQANGAPVQSPPEPEAGPEPEAVETKTMRKKARLAKVLGPHELVARPRRERPPPPPPLGGSPPRGIADAVKLRTAGAQEKKNARQQVGERVFASRLPPGFSVSAVIAAAAAAPPSPVPKIRGRPPKQKNGLGASRLGGPKQAEEDEEERRAQLQREEHEAAVRIFKEEEDERERLVKERGSFYPRDESLADRPRPPPVHGKRRTKSALLAELAQTQRNDSEDGFDDDIDGGALFDDDEFSASKGEAREALLHRKRVEMRARRRADRDEKGGAEPEELHPPSTNGEVRGGKRDWRKKRRAGWTMVRTQKRTAVANGGRFREDRGDGAGPSRRPQSHTPRGHRTHFPPDPDPDPTYDSDANSSELKMGQKLDEHGFFERDEFEVASHEQGGPSAGRKPPRERLPLEAPPQRRRSFGHRKGPSGAQAREGLREGRTAAVQGGGTSGRPAGGASEVVKPERDTEQNRGAGSSGNLTGGKDENEAKRPRWDGPWVTNTGAGLLHGDSMNVTTGREGVEPIQSREHIPDAATVTSF